MIFQKTVFVIGAGGSDPYGFPTGYGLKKQIENMLEPDEDGFKILRQCGYTKGSLTKFKNNLKYCGLRSVDRYLEKNPKFVPLGKEAIALRILELENQNNLFRYDISGDWYHYLYNYMIEESPSIENNNVVFLTYNYDRSLERYLFIVTRKSKSLSFKDSVSIMKKIPIVHLHGRVGALNWQSGKTISYGTGITRQVVEDAAQEIKIITEVDVKDAEFQLAHDYIKSAQRIIFLGFGYDFENLNRLKLMGAPDSCKIYGTMQDIPHGKGVQIENKFKTIFNPDQFRSYPMDCLGILETLLGDKVR